MLTDLRNLATVMIMHLLSVVTTSHNPHMRKYVVSFVNRLHAALLVQHVVRFIHDNSQRLLQTVGAVTIS